MTLWLRRMPSSLAPRRSMPRRLGDGGIPELPQLAVLHRRDQVVAMAVRERLEGGARAAQGNGLKPCHVCDPAQVLDSIIPGPRELRSAPWYRVRPFSATSFS